MTTKTVSTSPSFLKSITEPIAEFSKDRFGRITGLVCAILGLGLGVLVCSTSPIPVALRTLMTIGSALSLTFAGAIYHFSRQAVTNVSGKNQPGASPNIGSDRASQKSYRVEIMKETLANLESRSYISPDGTKHALNVESSVNDTQIYNGPLTEGNAVQRPGKIQTKLSIQNQDCLVVAKQLHDKGLTPCVLDMACNDHFGGGYKTGASAQEEDLCRRTTLPVIASMIKNFYPLHKQAVAAGLYVPDVTVFRSAYNESYEYLNEPFPIGVGVIAAFQNPHIHQGKLGEPTRSQTRDKIRNFFDMAHKNGHKSVVFGAFGCGAFGNPPEDIAAITLDVIKREFKSCFEEIVFAVIDDKNTGKAHNPHGNFVPFQKAINAYNANK